MPLIEIKTTAGERETLSLAARLVIGPCKATLIPTYLVVSRKLIRKVNNNIQLIFSDQSAVIKEGSLILSEKEEGMHTWRRTKNETKYILIAYYAMLFEPARDDFLEVNIRQTILNSQRLLRNWADRPDRLHPALQRPLLEDVAVRRPQWVDQKFAVKCTLELRWRCIQRFEISVHLHLGFCGRFALTSR